MFEFNNMGQWKLFITNPVFISAISSWLLSQTIKTILAFFSSGIKNPFAYVELLFWKTGGMPSSHSALVASLSTSIGIKNGFCSDFFIFSIFFALVVIRDAVGVRRSSGLQAMTLNDLGEKFAEKYKDYDFKVLKEIQGHKPAEAFAGVILGIITAVLVSYFG